MNPFMDDEFLASIDILKIYLSEAAPDENSMDIFTSVLEPKLNTLVYPKFNPVFKL